MAVLDVVSICPFVGKNGADAGPSERTASAGGLPGVVRDGETGALRPVGDVDAMATAALDILRDRDGWAAMSAQPSPWTTTRIELPVNCNANFVCIASFCDWDTNEDPKPGEDVAERVGQQLAEAIFVYDHGAQEKFPLRRRFEVNAPSLRWGISRSIHSPIVRMRLAD